MRKMYSVIFLSAFLVVCGIALATSSVPERNQESEQKIASMEVNQSAGNMTGEDYVIALIYAYMQDVQNGTCPLNPGPIFRAIEEEAISIYPEYKSVYRILDDGLGSTCDELRDMILTPSNLVYENMSEVPESNIIGVIQYVFRRNDVIDNARAEYQTRIAEENELNAMKEKREAERLRKQQENEARQAALDAHYRSLYENTTKELQDLVNESENATNSISKENILGDALQLLNNSSVDLVSPYSNILLIHEGSILLSIGTFLQNDNRTNALNIISALERFEYAKTNFTYCNESEDYQNAIYEDFFDEWDPKIQMMTEIAEDRLKEELYAMVTDLRDAPNAKQLLSGHINKKYEVTVFNYSEPMLIKALEASDYPFSVEPGYWVHVNISGYNDPEISETDFDQIDDYMNQNIPTFIDIFSSLFSDERISVVVVQLNRTYYDRFGNTGETLSMSARLDNVTTKEISDWTTFKKYVGKDMDKFRQAVDVY